MRYKRRYRRYRRNSTNVIKMKFQSFMDISTDVDSMKIITISAGGKNIMERCKAQFSAYKFYKIGNISVKLVPASTLPADPSGLSYEAGDTATIDPRDQLSPGLMRITNGEDILEDITGVSDEVQRKIYNTMMLDPHWYKWMLQSGVKRHATPRYWQIGQLHQDKWPGAFVNVPSVTLDAEEQPVLVGTGNIAQSVDASKNVNQIVRDSGSSNLGIFQTGHKGVLGWLPTDNYQWIVGDDGEFHREPLLCSPPEIAVFTICLPKAYKTRYYYRAYISETVYFREPIVSMDISDNLYRPIDVFHSIGYPVPHTPMETGGGAIPDDYTGGNYGNN